MPRASVNTFLKSLIHPLFALIFCFKPVTAPAVTMVEITSSLNPVGSGARATGMGGAFIGVADDATAASWNPAGLVQLERPEISAVYSNFRRTQTYVSPLHSKSGTENTMDAEGANYASAAYPFVLLGKNIVISFNYQRLYELNKDTAFNYTWDLGSDKLYDRIRFHQSGYLSAHGPAMAVRLTPALAIGATINLWDNSLAREGWNNTYHSLAVGNLGGTLFRMEAEVRNDISFTGVNANVGLLWNISGLFTLGAVFKSPFDASLTRETSLFESAALPEFDIYQESTNRSREDLTMTMPLSYGLGLQYRHSDALTFALDIYRTGWSRFSMLDSNDDERNPVSGRPLSEGRLKDTTQVRLGMEYLIIRTKDVIPIRYGVFYDPEAATGKLNDYYGISLGTGYSRGNITFDLAYQYRFGRKVDSEVPNVDADLDQHTVMSSVIWRF